MQAGDSGHDLGYDYVETPESMGLTVWHVNWTSTSAPAAVW